MIQPNNLRNRWRRYSQTRHAYGFGSLPIRLWARGAGQTASYATCPGYRDEQVLLLACRCRKGALICTCPKEKANA